MNTQLTVFEPENALHGVIICAHNRIY